MSDESLSELSLEFTSEFLSTSHSLLLAYLAIFITELENFSPVFALAFKVTVLVLVDF